MREDATKQIALLIDADNLGPAALEQVFDTLQKSGHRVTVVRAYGGLEKFAAVKEVLRRHAVRALVNQGKGTTDVALVIDAMDLLHGGQLPGTVAVVSSDADFAPLAVRLREAGIDVWCFAMRLNATAASLQRAYDQVIFLDDLLPEATVKPSNMLTATLEGDVPVQKVAADQPQPAPKPPKVSKPEVAKPAPTAMSLPGLSVDDEAMVGLILAAVPDWLPNTVKVLNQLGGPLRTSGIAKGSKPLHELFRKYPAYFKVQPPTGPAKQIKLLKKPV